MTMKDIKKGMALALEREDYDWLCNLCIDLDLYSIEYGRKTMKWLVVRAHRLNLEHLTDKLRRYGYIDSDIIYDRKSAPEDIQKACNNFID